MTGLLHRLAARANGSAWTVRSDARLPFAAEGLGQEAVAEAAAPAPQGEPAPLLRPAGAPAPAGRTETAETIDPSAPETAWRMAATPRLQHSPWQGSASEPLTATASATLGEHAPQPADTPVQRPSATTHSAQPTPAWPPEQARAPRPSATWHAPAPLLPPTAAAMNASAVRAQPGTWPGIAQTAAREDTEVHIHIGRIDVTAVHETPRPKARPRERAQPVSLDAYLAARNTQ